MPIVLALTDFTLTRNEIIESALRKCGVLDPESGTPTATQYSVGSQALNIVVKRFHDEGMPLWAISEAEMTLVDGQRSYTVSNIGIDRPIRVFQAYIKDINTGSQSPLTILTRDEYYNLGNLTSEGTPSQLYYDPQLDRSATVHVFPTPDTYTAANKKIYFFYQRPFQDIEDPGDYLDFPQEWFSAIVWELALVLAYEYGAPDNKIRMLQQKAVMERESVEGIGQEEGSIRFMPDLRRWN